MPRRSRLPQHPAVRPSAVLSAPLAALLLTACAGLRPAPPARSGASTPAANRLPAPPSAEDAERLRARRLQLPVAGVRVEQVRDAFADGRGDRVHLAIDIMAPRGTPVLSADDGRIWKLRSNSLGGITIYTTDPAERFVYYYAHLDRYRDGLTEGMSVLRGDTLGFVGTTGNAPANVPHLHFQVARLGADRRWWTGTPIDPLPYLREAAGMAPHVSPRATLARREASASAPHATPSVTARVGVPRPTVPTFDDDSSAATDSLLTTRAAAPRP
ncbi:MAG: M23 family metallopeptidase [Gemmatirosa sp.]